MRIAINTRWLLHNKLAGIGNFSHNLLSRIVINHPEVQFDFYFDRAFHPSFIYADNVKAHILFPPARHPYLWYIWYEFSLKQKLNRTKPDLFFSPDGFIPTSGNIKTLNTIHDLNFEHHPEWIPNFAIGYYKKYFPLCAEKATHLVTVSEYSKQDISTQYNIESNKIDVVYNGVEDFIISDSPNLKNLKTKLLGNSPYFIFIGAINPRKNLQNIFPAFDKLNGNHKLLVVGDKMHWNTEIEIAFNYMHNKDKVVFSGRLEKEALHYLLAKADALIFPSLFEGFGIPIIEAFKANTAVITANNTSMPEVAGDAALLVDAYSADAITDAMQKLAKDDNFKNSLIKKGQERANNFTWDKSAEKLWSVMEKTIRK